jgi:hypothetical protein
VKVTEFGYEFVEFIPDQLAEGTVYVSIAYATVVHSCASGCGKEVVTPLGPTDWQLIFDGESISLTPSIGNWSFPCQSHYWIRRNKVIWAPRWSRTQIERGRARDRAMKDRYFAGTPIEPVFSHEPERPKARHKGLFRRFWTRMRGS